MCNLLIHVVKKRDKELGNHRYLPKLQNRRYEPKIDLKKRLQKLQIENNNPNTTKTANLMAKKGKNLKQTM